MLRVSPWPFDEGGDGGIGRGWRACLGSPWSRCPVGADDDRHDAAGAGEQGEDGRGDRDDHGGPLGAFVVPPAVVAMIRPPITGCLRRAPSTRRQPSGCAARAGGCDTLARRERAGCRCRRERERLSAAPGSAAGGPAARRRAGGGSPYSLTPRYVRFGNSRRYRAWPTPGRRAGTVPPPARDPTRWTVPVTPGPVVAEVSAAGARRRCGPARRRPRSGR